MATTLIKINAIVTTFICTAGGLGNALIIYAFLNVKALRNTNNIFLFQLAMIDLMKSVLILPFKAYNQLEDKDRMFEFYCQPTGFISTISFVHSALLLAAIAVVRYFKVVRPRHFNKVFARKRTYWYSLGILVATTSLAVLPIAGVGKYEYSKHHGVCFTKWSSKNIPFRSLFYVYTIGATYPILTFCYARIFIKIRKHQRVITINKQLLDRKPVEITKIVKSQATEAQEMVKKGKSKCEVTRYSDKKDAETNTAGTEESHPSEHGNDEQKTTDGVNEAEQKSISKVFEEDKAETQTQKRKNQRAIRSEIRVTKVMFTVVITYSVCWLPAFIVTILALSNAVPVSDDILYIIVTLVDLKVFLNPLIYGLWNHQFRKGFKALFIKKYEYDRSSEPGPSRTGNSNLR